MERTHGTDDAPSPSSHWQGSDLASEWNDVLVLAARACDLPIAVLSLGAGLDQVPCLSIGLDASRLEFLATACRRVAQGSAKGMVLDDEQVPELAVALHAAARTKSCFLAGVPLFDADGRVLGTLCVLSRESEDWDARRGEVLALIGVHLAGCIQIRRPVNAPDDSTRKTSGQLHAELAAVEFIAMDAVVRLDTDGRVTSWNPGAERLYGFSAGEMLGAPIQRVVPEDCRAEHERMFRLCLAGGRCDSHEAGRVHKDGRNLRVLVSCAPIVDGGGRVIGVAKSACDITALRLREGELDRVSRLYSALTKIVRVIAQEPPREALFHAACQCLVEDAGFSTAWIGWFEPETGRMRPASVFGAAREFLEQVKIYADNRPEGRGLIGTVFRTGRSGVCNDMENDPRLAPWIDIVRSSRLRSVAAVPIRDGGRVAGTLNVYSHELGFFRDAEVSLLERFANGISFGLEVLARSDVMRLTRQEIENERHFADSMIESMPGVLYLYDRGGRFLRWSKSLERLSGLSADQIRALSPLDFVLESDRDRLGAAIARVFEQGEASVEVNMLSPRNGIRPYLLTGRRVELDGAACLVGVGIDISDRIEADALRKRSEDRYSRLFEHAPAGVILCDAHGMCVDANPAACKIFGLDHSDLVGVHLSEIVGAGNIPPGAASMDRFLGGGRIQEDWDLSAGGGRNAIVRVIATQMPDGTFLLALNDITRRMGQERRLARMSRLRRMIGGIHSAMLRRKDRLWLLSEACRFAITDGDFVMAWVVEMDSSTGMLRRLTGKASCNSADSVEEGAVLDPAEFRDTLGVRAHRSARPVIANEITKDDVTLPECIRVSDPCGARSGAAFPLLVAGKVDCALVLLAPEPGFFDDEEVELLEWVSNDLSYALDHIETSSRLRQLIHFDPLTGLMNAQSFREALDEVAKSVQSQHGCLCVCALDLVDFSRINQQFGHALGDSLLRDVGARLKSVFASPSLVARVGGDTFAIANPSIASEIEGHCEEVRERITSAFEKPFPVNDKSVQLSVRIGAVHYPADMAGGKEMPDLENARSALRHAKASGEWYLRYSTVLKLRNGLTMEAQLREAIDLQQFTLVYQPRVDLVSGEIVGAEALLRWQHPERGLIMPGEFIGTAERSGLIIPLGNWVLDQVCFQQAQWRAAGVPIVQISVNVSAIQINNSDLLQVVNETLARHRLPPDRIELELTESAVLQDMSTSARVLKQLREIGVGLALDDFGTGYSSLSHLKQLPFHRVKIDRSFIVDVTRSVEDAAIALAIIGIARSLRLKAVGEGVETQAQLKFLTQNHCDEMQGHFFSPPVDAASFVEFLRQGRKAVIPDAEQVDRRNLLIVDDESGICNALTRLLRRDGYHIITANSGAEALDLLAMHPVHVILSDQRMPGMSGTELLDKVKNLYPDTVRIILSGYTDLNVVTEAVNRGAVFRFLTKPWDDAMLRDQVRDAFTHYRENKG